MRPPPGYRSDSVKNHICAEKCRGTYTRRDVAVRACHVRSGGGDLPEGDRRIVRAAAVTPAPARIEHGHERVCVD